MPKSKLQIFYIGGGMTFKSHQGYLDYLKTRPVSLEKFDYWADDLEKELNKFAELIMPRMPLKENAKYNDWKIVFERYVPLLKDNIILIGNSLGGIFLTKYLSENKFPKKIKATYLIAPPYDNSIQGEDLVGGFRLKADLSLIEKNSPKTILLFSENDDIVPTSQAEKYKKKLKKTKIIILKNKNGHFLVPKFPELIKMIKGDLK